MKKPYSTVSFFLIIISILVLLYSCNQASSAENLPKPVIGKTDAKPAEPVVTAPKNVVPAFDTADYNKKMLALSNYDSTGKWPAKAPYPLGGALFPYNRIIAFYGNLYSKRMGILGELPKDSMF